MSAARPLTGPELAKALRDWTKGLAPGHPRYELIRLAAIVEALGAVSPPPGSAEPWVSLRHGYSTIAVLIEDPPPVRTRADGGCYLMVELAKEQAEALLSDLSRRVKELS